MALSNLHRQIGHLARSVGVNKATSLAKACRELNATVQLEVCPQRLSRLEETAELIARGDGERGVGVMGMWPWCNGRISLEMFVCVLITNKIMIEVCSFSENMAFIRRTGMMMMHHGFHFFQGSGSTRNLRNE